MQQGGNVQQQGQPSMQGHSPMEALQQQAGMMAQLPIMQKLMADPGMLERASQASPQLRAMLSQTPHLAAMMQPGSLQNLITAAQQPASLQQYVAGELSPLCTSSLS